MSSKYDYMCTTKCRKIQIQIPINTHSQPVEVEEDVTQTDQVVPSWLLPPHVHVDRDIPCQHETDIMYKRALSYLVIPCQQKTDISFTKRAYPICQQQTHKIRDIPCQQKTDIMYKEGMPYLSTGIPIFQQQTHKILMQMHQHIPCRADQCLVLPVVDVLTTAALAAYLAYNIHSTYSTCIYVYGWIEYICVWWLDNYSSTPSLLFTWHIAEKKLFLYNLYWIY